MQNLTSILLKLRLFKEEEKVFFAIWNILTCITAVCGNTFIIASIRRVSSLHLPSKVLLVCLALTDLCVGVITQPLYVAHILFPEYHSIGLYLLIGYNTTGFLFSGVSMLTITAISVDRLLARAEVQTSCNCMANKNPPHYFLDHKHGIRNNVLPLFWCHIIFRYCFYFTVYSNLNFLLRENMLCSSSSPGYSTTTRLPRRRKKAKS